MAGDGQFEVHESLQLRMAQVKDPVAEVEQSERGCDPDNAEQNMQKSRHLGVERRFACRECTVKIENYELFHPVPSSHGLRRCCVGSGPSSEARSPQRF